MGDWVNDARASIQESGMWKRDLNRMRAMVGDLTRQQRRELMTELTAAENKGASIDVIEGSRHVALALIVAARK